MNCPHCNKAINALTGFQEVEKFSKHLRSCKKNPDRKIIPSSVDERGLFQPAVNVTGYSIQEALKTRAESGQ